MQEIEIRADKNRAKKMLLDGPDWLSYLADCEISISCIFLQLLHQINVENIAKFGKNSFC